MTKAADDLKNLRSWTLGVVAFATAVSAFLVNALHLPLDITLLSVVGVSGVFLIVVYLINRVEQRQLEALEEHKQVNDAQIAEIRASLNEIKDIVLDTAASTLRIEMNDEITRHPENHDTILKMAHKYFIVYGKDWVQTEIFISWADEEEAAGRKVHIPKELLSDVMAKQEAELGH